MLDTELARMPGELNEHKLLNDWHTANEGIVDVITFTSSTEDGNAAGAHDLTQGNLVGRKSIRRDVNEGRGLKGDRATRNCIWNQTNETETRTYFHGDYTSRMFMRHRRSTSQIFM